LLFVVHDTWLSDNTAVNTWLRVNTWLSVNTWLWVNCLSDFWQSVHAVSIILHYTLVHRLSAHCASVVWIA
jgi:hypothetical protein